MAVYVIFSFRNNSFSCCKPILFIRVENIVYSYVSNNLVEIVGNTCCLHLKAAVSIAG